MTQKIRINLMRYRPDEDEKPWAQPFEIEWTPDMSILDALELLKADFDPSIAYRWSCRMEVCGSCGMVVNGEPRLACSTFVREFADVGEITIGALDNFPIEKDLVVDLDPFINKLNAVSPFIITKNPRALAEKEYLQTPEQLAKFKQYTMCINCMLCYQACPQIGINADYLGPAAIALAQRYNLDNRDEGNRQRYGALIDENGVWPCTFVGSCSEVCPKHVDPAGAIQQVKATAVPYWGLNLVKPEKTPKNKEA